MRVLYVGYIVFRAKFWSLNFLTHYVGLVGIILKIKISYTVQSWAGIAQSV